MSPLPSAAGEFFTRFIRLTLTVIFCVDQNEMQEFLYNYTTLLDLLPCTDDASSSSSSTTIISTDSLVTTSDYRPLTPESVTDLPTGWPGEYNDSKPTGS